MFQMVNILIVSSLLTGVDSQGYQLQCSALDAANNLYYLPNLPEGNDVQVLLTALSYTLSPAGITYIYSVPSTQVNCSGTVSAVEYCYRGSDEQLGTELLAFTLLTLEQNGRNFSITDRIEVRTTPRSQICTGSPLSTIQYCCDITSLNMADRFILPAPNFAFGIAIPPSSVSLLGFRDSSLQVAHYQEFQTVIPNVGSTFSVGNTVIQGLRVLRFHMIPTTTGTPATISTTTEDPTTPPTTGTPATISTTTTTPPTTGTPATISTTTTTTPITGTPANTTPRNPATTPTGTPNTTHTTGTPAIIPITGTSTPRTPRTPATIPTTGTPATTSTTGTPATITPDTSSLGTLAIAGITVGGVVAIVTLLTLTLIVITMTRKKKTRALNFSKQKSPEYGIEMLNSTAETEPKNPIDNDYDYCDVPIRHIPLVTNEAYVPTSIHMEENQAYASTMKKEDLSMHNNIGPAAYIPVVTNEAYISHHNRESTQNQRSKPRTDDDGDYENDDWESTSPKYPRNEQ